MKTEAIQRLINEATEARGAALELYALEESHRAMSGILADMLLEDGHLHECQHVTELGKCSARCARVRAALKCAGVLP